MDNWCSDFGVAGFAKPGAGSGAPVGRRRRSQESGYAYLFALLAIIAVLLASTTAMQNLLTSGRRQREEDMIWRGNQIVRAVRLYYHTTGKYPTSLEDLQNGIGAGDIHVLRAAALKDPTNKTDGTWRFIYTNAAGQIIGSVRYATLQQMALMDQNGGQMPVTPPGAQIGVSAASMASASAGNQAAQMPGQPAGAPGLATMSSGAGAAVTSLQPTGPVTGQMLGAFLDGVAGTEDTPSVKVYKGAKTYLQFEFIWNPLEDQAAAIAQGLNTNPSAAPGQPGVPVAPGPGNAPRDKLVRTWAASGARAWLGSGGPRPRLRTLPRSKPLGVMGWTFM